MTGFVGPVDDAEEPLTLRQKELSDLQDYVQKALAERPEFRQLFEAIEAQKQQVQATHGDRYPSFFVALAGAPGRDRFDNPYIPMNSTMLTQQLFQA